MTFGEVVSRFPGVRVRGRRAVAKCPAHRDRSPSLTLREAADGRTLVHCFAGCDVDAVLAAVGLQARDLFAGPAERPRPRPDLRVLQGAAPRRPRSGRERRTAWWVVADRAHGLVVDVLRIGLPRTLRIRVWPCGAVVSERALFEIVALDLRDDPAVGARLRACLPPAPSPIRSAICAALDQVLADLEAAEAGNRSTTPAGNGWAAG